MDDLIGTHHDITPLVLGTASDVKYRTETQVKQKRITSPKSKTPKCSPIDSLQSYFQERDKVDDAQREKLITGMNETNETLKQFLEIFKM